MVRNIDTISDNYNVSDSYRLEGRSYVFLSMIYIFKAIESMKLTYLLLLESKY